MNRNLVVKTFKAIVMVTSLLASVAYLSDRVANAAEPKTLETDWTYDVYYASHTGLTTATDDVAGYAGLGVSTNSLDNIVGVSWSAMAIGANASFTISFPTKTYSPHAIGAGGFNNTAPYNWGTAPPAISTTPTIGLIAGYPLEDDFLAFTKNPVFTWTLNPASTVYIWVDFMRQRKP